MVFSIKQDQQERWERGIEQWRHVTDGLGQTIDPGILETVVALNLLSVRTIASCEGHLDVGEAYPWINLGTPESELDEQKRQYDELDRVFMSLCELGPMGLPEKISEDALRVFHKRNVLTQKLRSTHQAMIARLLPHLTRFYADRSSSFDAHLTFSPIEPFGMMSLHPVGGFFQEMRPEEERRYKLLEYQEEMRAFTLFLKKQLFVGTRLS